MSFFTRIRRANDITFPEVTDRLPAALPAIPDQFGADHLTSILKTTDALKKEAAKPKGFAKFRAGLAERVKGASSFLSSFSNKPDQTPETQFANDNETLLLTQKASLLDRVAAMGQNLKNSETVAKVANPASSFWNRAKSVGKLTSDFTAKATHNVGILAGRASASLKDPEFRRQAAAAIWAGMKNPDTYGQIVSSAAMGMGVKALLGVGLGTSLMPAMVVGGLTSVIVGNIQKEYKKLHADDVKPEIHSLRGKLWNSAKNATKVAGFGLKHTLTGQLRKSLRDEWREEKKAILLRAGLGAASAGLALGIAELIKHIHVPEGLTNLSRQEHGGVPRFEKNFIKLNSGLPDAPQQALVAPHVPSPSIVEPSALDQAIDIVQSNHYHLSPNAVELAQHGNADAIKEIAHAINTNGIASDDHLIPELLKAAEHAKNVAHAVHSTPVIHAPVVPAVPDTSVLDSTVNSLPDNALIAGGAAATSAALIAGANALPAIALSAAQIEIDTAPARAAEICQLTDVTDSDKIRIRCSAEPEHAQMRPGDYLQLVYTNAAGVIAVENEKNTNDFTVPTADFVKALTNDNPEAFATIVNDLRATAANKFNRYSATASSPIPVAANDTSSRPSVKVSWGPR